MTSSSLEALQLFSVSNETTVTLVSTKTRAIRGIYFNKRIRIISDPLILLEASIVIMVKTVMFRKPEGEKMNCKKQPIFCIA